MPVGLSTTGCSQYKRDLRNVGVGPDCFTRRGPIDCQSPGNHAGEAAYAGAVRVTHYCRPQMAENEDLIERIAEVA